MKPIIVFFTYIVGFIIFYKLMLWLSIDNILFSFISSSDIKIKKQKIGEFLTPEGATKPLALTKQEIGRDTWALLHSIAASYPNEPNEEDKKQIFYMD